MKSIFDLKTKNSELSSANQGLTNYKYRELQSLRSIEGDKFSDSEILYRWTYGSNKYWIPNKSYLKVRMSLSQPDGTRIPATKGVTFAMNTIALLFQSSTFKIADNTVCSVTQNLPQISTLKYRQNRSGAWLNSIGNDINNLASSYAKRERNMLTAGGNNISELNIYKDWTTILDACNIQAGDSVAVTNAAADGGISKITFTDAADSNLDLTLLTDVKVGDVVIYEYGITELTVVTQRKASGVITKITTTEIQFIPNLINATIGNATIPTNKFKLQLARHDYYDEDDSQLAKSIELCWTPCLSIFDIQHAIPCCGTKMEFSVTSYPESVYQKNCVESRGRSMTNSTTDGNDNFLIKILDMRFNLLTCDSNKVQDNFQFMLDLNEIQCQSSPLTSTSQEQSLDVTPSTNFLTFCVQDQDTLNNTQYPMSNFKIRDNLEQNLTRYWLRYEGQVREPDFEGEFVRIGSDASTGSKDTLKDLYYRTKIYDGTINYERPETYEEWLSRGMYVSHAFPKTQSSKNTRVVVKLFFSSLDDATSTKQEPFLLLFSHSKKVVVCTVQNGRIVGIAPYNA